MKTTIRVSLLSALLMAALATPAVAQEVTLGYQWQRLTCCDFDENLPLGVTADVSLPFAGSPLAAVAQLDWSRMSEDDFADTVTGLGGGVRWNVPRLPLRPFVQGLAGLARSTTAFQGVSFSQTDPAVQVGGGVALPLAGRYSFVGQADYRRIFGEEADTNSIRIVAAIRIAVR
jgi:hypothetical protein